MNLSRNLLAMALIASLSLPAQSEGLDWLLKADYVDACSCDLTCPCIFGESSTHGYCRGATLVDIKEGHYRQTDLSGITVLAIYDGGNWIKYVVSENATMEQTNTVAEFLPLAEGFFDSPLREVKNGPIAVERTEDTVKISTEETVVELLLKRGLTGEPIKVVGVPAHGFPGLPYLNHTQYKTITLTHNSAAESYSFSGTNGYTAEIDASSESVKSLPGLNPSASAVDGVNTLAYSPKNCDIAPP